tara:strand:+ start:1046 stop:1441 length:396 start_codon:yes stop_codon:yes gene_type:complete
MIKPDAVAENNIGGIIAIIEKSNFKIIALKMLLVETKLAKEHYKEHINKPFFKELVEFITSGPSVAIILEGQDCIKNLRDLVGNTNPAKAVQGTIRTKFGVDVGRNAVHASDSSEAAIREIDLFFNTSEIY